MGSKNELLPTWKNKENKERATKLPFPSKNVIDPCRNGLISKKRAYKHNSSFA
jgi:hypothetical protein